MNFSPTEFLDSHEHDRCKNLQKCKTKRKWKFRKEISKGRYNQMDGLSSAHTTANTTHEQHSTITNFLAH